MNAQLKARSDSGTDLGHRGSVRMDELTGFAPGRQIHWSDWRGFKLNWQGDGRQHKVIEME